MERTRTGRSEAVRARRAILRSNGIPSRHYAIDPVTLFFNDTNSGWLPGPSAR
jgi:hypothetical protein